MLIELPDNYVIPKALLDAIRKVHPAPPPVYKFIMDELMQAIVSPGACDLIEFPVPPYVVGYDLYDAQAVATWMATRLQHAGYDVRLLETPSRGQDMWPERHERKSAFIAFEYDEAEYVAALAAPAWTLVVTAR